MKQEIHDCYWFVKEDNQNSYIVACCVACGQRYNLGWFWEGTTKGYGDYDLSCELCKKSIYKKPE
jgi:hypothetical protein